MDVQKRLKMEKKKLQRETDSYDAMLRNKFAH